MPSDYEEDSESEDDQVKELSTPTLRHKQKDSVKAHRQSQNINMDKNMDKHSTPLFKSPSTHSAPLYKSRSHSTSVGNGAVLSESTVNVAPLPKSRSHSKIVWRVPSVKNKEIEHTGYRTLPNRDPSNHSNRLKREKSSVNSSPSSSYSLNSTYL